MLGQEPQAVEYAMKLLLVSFSLITSSAVSQTPDPTPVDARISGTVVDAVAVLEAQELDCHRYAGTDPAKLDRVLSTYCDYPMQSPTVSQQADPTPFFALLDDRPGILIRAWRAITRRSPSA
jgi:hypothetical protein